MIRWYSIQIRDKAISLRFLQGDSKMLVKSMAAMALQVLTKNSENVG